MSNRRTSKWTDTLGEAYGVPGVKGTRGEIMACSLLDSIGIEYDYQPTTKIIQISGIDIYIGKHGMDVKANLHSTKKEVAVEWPKIIKSKAKWWMHINLNDPDDYIIYETAKMITYIHENNIPKVGRDHLCWVNQTVASAI